MTRESKTRLYLVQYQMGRPCPITYLYACLTRKHVCNACMYVRKRVCTIARYPRDYFSAWINISLNISANLVMNKVYNTPTYRNCSSGSKLFWIPYGHRYLTSVLQGQTFLNVSNHLSTFRQFSDIFSHDILQGCEWYQTQFDVLQ